MGDTGANALGGVLGLFMAINFSMAARLLVLIALILSTLPLNAIFSQDCCGAHVTVR